MQTSFVLIAVETRYTDNIFFIAGCVFLAALIGAALLRVAVWLYNGFVGAPRSESARIGMRGPGWGHRRIATRPPISSGVPDLSFGGALGIELVTILVDWGLVSLALVMILDRRLVYFIGAAGNVLVESLLLAFLLPTTFARAIVLSLCRILLTACVMIVLFAAIIIVLKLLRSLFAA